MAFSSAKAWGIASSIDGLLAALALAHHFGDRLRRADARHHVFALGIDQEFAIEQLFAGGGIAGEGDAGGRGFAAIAEHHGLHRDGGAPVLGNVVQPAIGVGARGSASCRTPRRWRPTAVPAHLPGKGLPSSFSTRSL